jgi:hypothetical protein
LRLGLGRTWSWQWWEARSHGRSLRSYIDKSLLLTWLKHAGLEIRHVGRDMDRRICNDCHNEREDCLRAVI